MTQQEQLKSKLIDILQWFHSFCEENNLRYYALGGTMLGAARHEGFIPWDDDIDVGMPREDYNRLAELLNNSPNERYMLETPDTTAKDYFYPFSKLYDTETTLVENTKYKIKRGIYIDIFPLDGIGNSYEESKKNSKSVYNIHNLLLLKIAGIRKGRSLYKNLAVVLFRFIPIRAKWVLKKLTVKCSKYSWDECLWVGNLVGAWRFNEVMPKEYLGTPQKYKFENIVIYGVENPDAYLTSLYGNWRQLPPIEKQVSHHDFILCDLEKSFLEE